MTSPTRSGAWALGLGAVAGLRSAMASALLSHAASRGEIRGIEVMAFAQAASGKVSRVLSLLAAGEAIRNMTPAVPSRTPSRTSAPAGGLRRRCPSKRE